MHARKTKEFHTDKPSRAGFALVIVLSAIIILTALFAVTMARLETQVIRTSVESALLDRRAQNRMALDAARIAANQPDFDPAKPLILPDQDLTIRLQDVGGLVDVNTANPRLIEALFEQFELSAEHLDHYRAWRRDGRRFRSLEHFQRVVGFPEILGSDMMAMTTVFSGRTGIAPESAPGAVMDLVRGLAGGGDLPLELISPPSGTTFDVLIDREGHTSRAGTIFVAPDGGPSRILEIR